MLLFYQYFLAWKSHYLKVILVLINKISNAKNQYLISKLSFFIHFSKLKFIKGIVFSIQIKQKNYHATMKSYQKVSKFFSLCFRLTKILQRLVTSNNIQRIQKSNILAHNHLLKAHVKDFAQTSYIFQDDEKTIKFRIIFAWQSQMCKHHGLKLFTQLYFKKKYFFYLFLDNLWIRKTKKNFYKNSNTK
ncbi:unnamed protein product [Paramecium sonneborni]|uniref:Uncharacterized protein n=1 Tax=Paramecium sonneborni TaxID=65129 RepID=A0A8S1NLA5_9CILI|nr:unnamed protein product [Paramecium sonneborni]